MIIAIRKLVCWGLVLSVVFGASIAIAAGPNLIAAFFVKGRVGLKWNKVEGIEEYLVYRKPSSGEFEMIAKVNDDHYFDDNVSPGTTYQYKVAIVGSGGEEFSQPKSVTIPGEVGEFAPPVWVGARIDKGKIFLNWDPVAGAVAYNIYRSKTPGANFEVVGNTQASSHADNQDLEAGVTYYYVLTAMNADFEETARSEERSIQFGMTAAERDRVAAEQAQVKLEPLKLTHVYDLTEGEGGQPMNQPSDVYSNSKGQVFVTDALNARVHCFDTDGKRLFTFGAAAGSDPAHYENGSFKIPFTLHVDKKDQIWVSDVGRHDIQLFAPDGGFVKRIVVAMEDGMEPLRANGICPLDDGRIAIADTGNHRLLIIDSDGKILSAKGKRGAAEGEFSFPGEIEHSDSGELFIVDVINARVQVFDLQGNFLRAFGEIGDGAGMFGRPAGLTLGPKGRVWVSDNMSCMIQTFTPQGEVKSVLGSVQDDWRFASPRGMHFVGNRLYVVDRLKNKVVVFDLG